MLTMAKNAREAYARDQARREKETVEVAGFAERLVTTSAGDTKVLISWPAPKGPERVPVFVNFHGGGFVMGSAYDDDAWCRKITNAVGCAVVNVDYHLSPEHKFPVALEECYDTVKWVHDNAAALGVDAGLIAVGGHSAGGNLAAALSLLARQRREFPLVLQVLDYPPLNLSVDPAEKATGDRMLTPKVQAFFTACYIRSAGDTADPLVSPLLSRDLAGLPPALIISAELDPLCREDGEYAQRLAANGVAVTHKTFAGCSHAFTHFGPAVAAAQAWELIHSQLRKAFARQNQ